MRTINVRFFGNLFVLFLILGAGYVLYQRDLATGSEGDPIAAIDTTAVRQRLQSIARSQWQFHAEHGRYATLDELESIDQLPGGQVQRGYEFSGTASATGFHVTATPIDEEKADWPTLEIDQTMRVIEK